MQKHMFYMYWTFSEGVTPVINQLPNRGWLISCSSLRICRRLAAFHIRLR